MTILEGLGGVAIFYILIWTFAQCGMWWMDMLEWYKKKYHKDE